MTQFGNVELVTKNTNFHPTIHLVNAILIIQLKCYEKRKTNFYQQGSKRTTVSYQHMVSPKKALIRNFG
jgi:hypothetical protein